MDGNGRRTVRRIHEYFTRSGRTLSVAESCTGGYISHLITALPGASGFFTAGVVAYSADAKKALLGVPAHCIARYGVVSEQTARSMAENVRRIAGTDYSLATTGNLGPDVLEEKARGLIYMAVSDNGRTLAQELRLTGTRSEVKREASLRALQFLLATAEGNGVARKKSRP